MHWKLTIDHDYNCDSYANLVDFRSGAGPWDALVGPVAGMARRATGYFT